MTQNKFKTAALGILLAAGAGLAQAQAPTIDDGFYVGGTIGQAQATNYDCTVFPQCESRGSAGRLFTGYQFARHWAAEVAFTDLGQIDSSLPGTFNESIKVRMGEVAVLASYPATARMMLYGRVGGYYANSTHDFSGTNVESRFVQSGGGVAWGFGAQYFFWRGLGVRGEAARYMKVKVDGTNAGNNGNDIDYTMYSIGLVLKM